MSAGRALPTALVSCALALSSAAQTPDPVFSGFSFAPEGVGSRPAGMGGAFVALADDTKAAVANPAGLTLIPLTELALSSGERWAAASAGGRVLRLAAYVTHAEMGSAALEASTWEEGVATGLRPLRRLRVGVAAAWSRLGLDASPSAGTSGSSGDGHVRFTAGVLLDLLDTSRRALPALRAGLSYRPGFDWSAHLASPGAAATAVDIRRPSVLAAGLAYRPSDRWTLAMQGDLIRYREVVDTLRRNAGDAEQGFGLPDVIEPRAGVEFSAPLWCGCGVVKLRGGIHHRSAGSLRYDGPDPALALAFEHDPWKTVATLGGSFFAEYFGHALRLDVDSRDITGGPELSFGLVFRF